MLGCAQRPDGLQGLEPGRAGGRTVWTTCLEVLDNLRGAPGLRAPGRSGRARGASVRPAPDPLPGVRGGAAAERRWEAPRGRSLGSTATRGVGSGLVALKWGLGSTFSVSLCLRNELGGERRSE